MYVLSCLLAREKVCRAFMPVSACLPTRADSSFPRACRALRLVEKENKNGGKEKIKLLEEIAYEISKHAVAEGQRRLRARRTAARRGS